MTAPPAPAATPMERVRLDSWLWAARFYKSRSLAKAAVAGGKVHCNGARARPAKPLATGEELTIVRGARSEIVQTVMVTGLADRRRGAKEAAALYAETPASIDRRQAASAERRRQRAGMTPPAAKPDKRDRRRLLQAKAAGTET